MATYWGSRYVAVTADLENSRIEQVDLRPFGVSGTSDDLLCPVPEHLDGCEIFDHLGPAEQVVRKHIFTAAKDKIVELVAGIEHTKLTREIIRDLEPATDANQRHIDALTDSMAEMTAELKKVRAIKRSRIRVV